MRPAIEKQKKIYKEEAGLFFGALSLIFLIRCGGIIFNNFSETVFLKRFGVEFLPILYIVNPFVTLFLIGILTRIKDRFSAYDRLFGMMSICSVSVFLLWIMPAREGGLMYPALFMMKVQFEAMLSILFWNLCNELFNFSQSKRIFPLITAGGVLGDMGGNLASILFSKFIPINQMMVVYSVLLIFAAGITRYMGRQLPLQVIPGQSYSPPKKKTGLFSQTKAITELAKKSGLVKVIIGLAFFANLILPIMNYQFNICIDNGIVDEDFMVFFFGSFRGIMNIVSLALLFFSGRIYEKWSIPSALMFHPLNYVLVFLSFFFRFDLFSAIYARFSTNVIRTTFNQPVNNMIIGIFPDQYRSMLRPFMRGVVARGGLIAGSSAILLFKGWISAPDLSLIALPFVVCWIATVITMKRNYGEYIVELLSSDTLDLKSMEDHNLYKLFNEKKILEKLLNNFSRAEGEDAVLLAHILSDLGVDNLDDRILENLERQDRTTMTRLMGFLSGTSRKKTFKTMENLIDVNDRRLTRAMIQVVTLLNRKDCRDFFEILRQQCTKRGFKDDVSYEIRAYINACMLLSTSGSSREMIHKWLNDPDRNKNYAGIIAAGQSGDPDHITDLKRVMKENAAKPIVIAALGSLHKLKYPDMDTIAEPLLHHPDADVRLVALEFSAMNDEKIQRTVLSLFKDHSEAVRRLAIKKIKTCSHCNGLLLYESLGKPSRRIREGVFSVLATLAIKDPDLFAFFQKEIESAKKCRSITHILTQLDETPTNELLQRHLTEIQNRHVKTILRVAALHDYSGRIRTIVKNLYSSDRRKRTNAIEALTMAMEPKLVKQLLPFLSEKPAQNGRIRTKKQFRIPDSDHGTIQTLVDLLQNRDWITATLTRGLIREIGLDGNSQIREYFVNTFTQKPKISVEASYKRHRDVVETEISMKKKLSLQEKIVLIQNVDIFKDLAINELAAISEIAQEKCFLPGSVLFDENEFADTMNICIQGRIITSRSDINVGHFEKGDSFGWSAFLLDSKRLLTCTAETVTHVLEIHKYEFEEILMEYPKISYEIAKISTHRIQRLLKQIEKGETQEALLENFFGRNHIA